MEQDKSYKNPPVSLNNPKDIYFSMKILFSGCSNTWGDELDDPEAQRYSRLVAKHFDAEDINVSDCGASVHMVSTFAMNYIKQYGMPDAVVIQWPPFYRSEFWRNRKRRLASLTPQDGICNKPDDHKEWSAYYFANIHNDALSADRWFVEMVAMENVMEQMEMPYVTISHNQWHEAAQQSCNCHPDYVERDIKKTYDLDFCPIYAPYLKKIPASIHGDIIPPVDGNVNTPEYSARWLKPRHHPNEEAHGLIAKHVIKKLEECF